MVQKRRDSRLGKAGFTLVELIAVMVIIAALMTAAMARIDNSAGSLDAVANVIRSNIQLAQDLSMTQDAVFGFESISASDYRIFDGAPGTPARDPLTGGDFEVTISPVAFVGVVPTITFTNGIPSNGALATITVQEASIQRQITVTPNTGFVQIP